MNTITLSQLFRVLNINWEEFLWGLFWMLGIFGVILIVVILSVIVIARQWFISNELPRLHDEKVEKLSKEVKFLKVEGDKSLKARDLLIVENGKLLIRLEKVKFNYEEGLKGK